MSTGADTRTYGTSSLSIAISDRIMCYVVAMPAIRWHTAMPPMRYGWIPICIVMVVVGIIP